MKRTYLFFVAFIFLVSFFCAIWLLPKKSPMGTSERQNSEETSVASFDDPEPASFRDTSPGQVRTAETVEVSGEQSMVAFAVWLAENMEGK